MLMNLTSKTPVLTYHDFIDKRDSKAVWFDCTTAEFEAQIAYLKEKGAKFITVDQLYENLTQGKPVPKNAIALTFADNYEGFYRRALPILRREKIPGTMFVHTAFVGGKTGRPKMTWAQLKEMQEEGLVKIGSQTVSHPIDLRMVSPEQLDRELVQSRATLRDRLGTDIPYLAYPNGKWNDITCDAAERAGYLMAFSEVTEPAEMSASIMSVNRYVHTKYREAWADGSQD